MRCFLIGAAGAGESVRPRRLCRPLWESPDALCSTCVRPGTSAGPSTSPLDDRLRAVPSVVRFCIH